MKKQVLVIIALFLGIYALTSGRRKGADAETERLQPVINALELSLETREEELHGIQRSLAIAETRLQEQRQHHQTEKVLLEEAEKRLSEAFERLAGKVFDERAQRFTQLSEKQLSGLLQRT